MIGIVIIVMQCTLLRWSISLCISWKATAIIDFTIPSADKSTHLCRSQPIYLYQGEVQQGALQAFDLDLLHPIRHVESLVCILQICRAQFAQSVCVLLQGRSLRTAPGLAHRVPACPIWSTSTYSCTVSRPAPSYASGDDIATQTRASHL